MVKRCISDAFGIYMGKDAAKRMDTLHIRSLEDMKGKEEHYRLMWWEHDDAICIHKNSEYHIWVAGLEQAKEYVGGKIVVEQMSDVYRSQQKQQALKDAFKDWIFKDPKRRQTLVHYYNETMNNTRPREYDGSHIVFSGMNPEIRLQPHQLNAIAHVLYGGNTLLAHEVEAGKTFEMIAAAMESKRLGLCQKSIFVVPNHLTE